MRSNRLLSAFAVAGLLAVQTEAQVYGVSTVAEQKTGPRVATAARTLHPAPLAAQWNLGPLYNTRDLECFGLGGPYDNYITGEYCGYYGDPQAATPRVGDVYYVVVHVGNVAACAVEQVYIEGFLPANTSLAVSAQKPVICWSNLGQIQPPPTDQCPQNLQIGTQGGYKLNPTGQPTWSLGRSAWIEVQVPVTSNAVTNDYFKAYVKAIDGWNNPTDYPQAGVYVSANATTPSIAYPAQSASPIANTTASTHAYLLNHFQGGTVYTDIGNSDSYGYTTPGAGVPPSAYDNTTVDTSWTGLFPGTTNHWRTWFVPMGGSPVYGLDQVFTTTGIPMPATVIREDFDYDGRSDLILQNSSTGDIARWKLNKAANAIAAGSVIASPGTAFKVVTTGFFNFDKYADLILQNTSTGDVVQWQMNGTTITAGATIGSPGTAYKVITTGDFNGDGYSDIVMQNTSTNAIAIWLMNGITLTGGSVIGAPGTYKVVATGDFNADGRSDLLLQDSSSGAIAIWQLNAAGTALQAGYLLGGSNPWKAIASGDVDADAKSEIILQNSTTGDIAVWKLNAGGTAITAGYNLGGSGTVWKLVGTGDYDADGNADLILQNTSSGYVARWQLNATGTAIATGAVVGTSGTVWVAVLN
ncbi:MAG: VCBS repeat-containing protein [Acidobacteriota bacterium]|nr:VCBS repeat-containing protein [Acidobacteriota bacterium]